jgi:hypothetical protein
VLHDPCQDGGKDFTGNVALVRGKRQIQIHVDPIVRLLAEVQPERSGQEGEQNGTDNKTSYL